MRMEWKWGAAWTALWMATFLPGSGCNDDAAVASHADEAMAGTASDSHSGDTDRPVIDAGPPPEPFSMPFEALVENRVRWASLAVSVVDARVERGMDELGPLLWLADPAAQVYVELDIRIENEGTREMDYSLRDTWALILSGGERLRPLGPLGVTIAPGDAPVTQLRYLVDDVVDLAGAMLELNGKEIGAFEPERIALDAPFERRYPLRPAQLAGVVIEPMNPPEDEDVVRFEIVDARYGVNDPEEGRAGPGMRFFSMDLFATEVDWIFGPPVVDSDDSFRLITDGRAQLPVSDIFEHVPSGVDVPLHVVFTIGASVRTFELGFSTHQGAELQRIAVDLDNAVLVDP